jgi:hypothetical protein
VVETSLSPHKSKAKRVGTIFRCLLITIVFVPLTLFVTLPTASVSANLTGNYSPDQATKPSKTGEAAPDVMGEVPAVNLLSWFQELPPKCPSEYREVVIPHAPSLLNVFRYRPPPLV